MGRELSKSIDIIISNMECAAKNNADILLLPECFITGYELPLTNEEALASDSAFIDMLCSAAKRLRIGVVATALTQGRTKPRNSAFLIDKNGKLPMKYSKVHTCDFAEEMTEGLFYADFDMEQLRAYREHEMMGKALKAALPTQ